MASARLEVTAADGMPVEVIGLPGDTYMGAAVGKLAPRTRYAVHFHYALEQLTYVLIGHVTLTMAGTTHHLGPGDALINPPCTTLDFANETDSPAEVLFVCAPPFPTDGSDVALSDGHRPLTEPERGEAGRRVAWALGHFSRVAEARRP